MKRVVASLTIGACLLLSSAGAVFAVDAHKATITTTPPTTGAPGRNGTKGSGVAGCGSAGTSTGTIQGSPPGQANSKSVTSVFNAPPGGAPGEKVYAGQTAGNSDSAPGAPASQYDNACFQHQVP
jgi:hypothetical protein